MTSLLKVEEAAKILCVTPGTVRAWIFYKKLRTVKIGRSVRIPADWLQKYIEDHTNFEQPKSPVVR
jgi:excisionase family DNA binding protein